MNKFIKYVLIPGLVLGASVGTTYGVTAHFKNQELDKRYQAGYESALSNEAYYKSQLETFQKLVDEQSLKIADFTTQVANLTKDNEDKSSQIESLNVQLSNAETQIESLETDNELKGGQISTLTSTVSDLQNEIVELQQSGLDKDVEISQLEAQISNLQLQISTLQTTITLNNQTIEALNLQIGNYQTQIANLQQQISNNANSIKDYTDQISALQKTIAYLESYIDSIVDENQSVVRFMYNGSVYNMQIVNNGSTATVNAPEDTNYIKFNYWMINNIEVDPTEYVVTEETEFVANLTYYYDVKFMNVETPVSSQIVIENGTATKPEDPTRTGYSFKGWSMDGTSVVDPATVTITDDTTFTALWVKVNTVTFNDGTSSTTQSVDTGDYPSVPATPTKDGYRFLGWSLDGSSVVDPTTIAITEDTTFTALWIKTHLVTFDDGKTQTSQTIDDGNYAIVPTDPTKEGYIFKGWSIDGSSVVDPTTVAITEDTTFNAIWDQYNISITMLDGSTSLIPVTTTISNGLISSSDRSKVAFLEIPEGVTTLESNAFSSFNNLIKITIPSTVTFIGDTVFSNCSKLVEIVNKSNVNLTAEDIGTGSSILNILSNADASNISIESGDVYTTYNGDIYYLGNITNNTNISIKTGTKYVLAYALNNKTNVTSIYLPNTIISIGYSAFYNTKCESIYIPSSVLTLENCIMPHSSITTITVYTGHDTKPADWSSNIGFGIKWSDLKTGYTYDEYLNDINQ